MLTDANDSRPQKNCSTMLTDANDSRHPAGGQRNCNAMLTEANNVNNSRSPAGGLRNCSTMATNAKNANNCRPRIRLPKTPPLPPRAFKPFHQPQCTKAPCDQPQRTRAPCDQPQRTRAPCDQPQRNRVCLSQSECSLSFLLRLCTSSSSGSSIDKKIEQALELVKIHVRTAVQDEVSVLRETIRDLKNRNLLLQQENLILRTVTGSKPGRKQV